jgi:hypothetical protein
MNDNPFKIIRSTDQPPEELRSQVVGSAKLVVLMMRFVQLFVADYASTLFENVRVIRPDPDGKENSPN